MPLFFLKFTFCYPEFDLLTIGPKGENVKGRLKHSGAWIDINLNDKKWLEVKSYHVSSTVIQSWIQF